MQTDRIYELLIKQAVDEEKARLESACSAYNKSLGLSGTVANIVLTSGDGASITVLTSDIFKAITQQLIEQRLERLKSAKVNEFLASVKSFAQQVHKLEMFGEESHE